MSQSYVKPFSLSLMVNLRFRWVSTSLQTLCNSHTMHLEADVRNALGRLPSELDDLYSIVMKDINDMADPSRAIARTVLQWLLSAKQPLSSEEFVKALNTGSETTVNREDILNICSNLVKLDEAVDSFEFMHLSIREYLEKRPEYQETVSNAAVANSCLAMCLYGKKPKRRQDNLMSQNKLFYDYAQIYWPVHCEIAEGKRTEGELGKRFRAFLCGGSRATKAFLTWKDGWWESWKAMNLSYNRSDDQDIYDRLQDCVSVVYTACVFGFVEVIQDRKLAGKDDSAMRSGSSRDYITTAIAYGQQKVILELQSTAHLSAFDTRKARLQVAAGKRDIQFVAEMLLQDSTLAITDAVVESAAASNSVEMVKYLINHSKEHPITITDRMFVMAAANGKHGCEVLEFLLDQMPDAGMLPPKDALEQACMNSRCGLQIIETLLAKRKCFPITNELIRYAAANRSENGRLLKLLLRDGHNVQVDEEMLIEVANSKTHEGLEALLPHTTTQVITSQVLLEASGNQKCANRLVPLLLERCDLVIITDDVLCEAIFNRQYGLNVVKALLFAKKGILITPQILETVVSSEFNGESVLRELLHLNFVLDFTSRVLQYAAENESCGRELLGIILEKNENVDITEEVFCAAASNTSWGSDILKMLFRHRPTLLISSDLVVAAARNNESGCEIMDFLFTQSKLREITAEAVEAAASNPHSGCKILDYWLKQGVCLEISQQAIEIAAANAISGAEIVKLLLENSTTLNISREAVEIGANNENCGDKILRLMVDYRGSIPIFESTLISAALNPECGLNIIKFFWEQEVSTSILFGAINELLRCTTTNHDALVLLLEKFQGFKPGPRTIENEAYIMREGGKMLRRLLDKNPGVHITNSAIDRVVEFAEDSVEGLDLILHYKPDFDMTYRVFFAAIRNENNTASTISSLMDNSKTRNWEHYITDEALESPISEYSSESIAVFRSLLRYKLSQGGKYLISERLVASAAKSPRAEIHLKYLAEKAHKWAIPLPITIKVYLAAAKNSKTAMSILRELDPIHFEEFTFNEEVLLNVVSNRKGYRILRLFSDSVPSWQNKVIITPRLLGESSGVKLRFLLQIIDLQCNGTLPSKFITEEMIKRIADGPIRDLIFIWEKLPPEVKRLDLARVAVKRALLNSDEIYSLFLWIRCLLLDRNLENLRQELISEEFILAAVANRLGVALSLLKQIDVMGAAGGCVPGIIITENILLGAAAAGNTLTLTYLLHRQQGLKDNAYYFRISRLTNAVSDNNPAIIRLLLQEGVLPDFEDAEGFTPLAVASFEGYYSSARALLENSQDINVNNTSSVMDRDWKWGVCRGRTPLCWAVLTGRIELVELLLEHGADPIIRDSNGMNAEDLAVEAGNDLIAEVLRNWRGLSVS